MKLCFRTVTQNTYDTSITVSPLTGSPLQTNYLLKTIKDYGSGKLNATTQFTYDAYGHVASLEDPNGNTATIATNALDQVTEADGPLGEVVQYFYDGEGHAVTSQKKLGSSEWQKVVNVYNSFEQLTQTHAYTNSSSYLTTSYAYDANGNQNSVTDPLGHATSLVFNERNLPYKKTDTLGKTTQTAFDANGNTSTLTDERGHVTTYTYDGLDTLEQKTFADGSYQTWKYDAGGRVTSQRTTAGNTISGTYDARNELLAESYPVTGGSSTITNAYDIMGRLLTATEGGTSLSYGYDNLGRVTSFTDQAGHASSYSYDLDGNRLSAAYPTGVTANCAYDALDRLSTLQDGSSHTLASYTYDSLDRPTLINLGNGTTETPGYDLLNRLTSLNNALSSVNRNYSYVYDDASRITSISEPRGTIATSYSDRNEVTGITEPSGSPFADQAFTYDAGFNRATWTLGTTTTSYTANNLNQYTAVGSATPTYNTDGGLATFSGNSYIYDALGRLTEVTNASGITLFSYDPFGRRVKKVDENTGGTVLATYAYHYDGSAVAVEYRASSVTWTYYGGVLRTDGSNNQYYYRDGQGSVSAVTDNSGNVLEAYEYNAQGWFQITNGSGTVLSSTGIGNDFMYTGQLYDAETGNYFYNARYYNPKLGRFISRDPLGGAEFSQGTNLYAYCGNDGVNESDPSGMDGNWVYAPASAEYTSLNWGNGPLKIWVAGKPSAAIDSRGPQRLGQVVFSPGFTSFPDHYMTDAQMGELWSMAMMPDDLGPLAKLAEDILKWLGPGARIIKNAKNDAVIMSDDKKLRFDVNNPHGDDPHFHMEEKGANGQWQDAGPDHRYYFDDQ